MSCGSCESSCNECTPYVLYNRGPRGVAGPAPNITIGVTVLPAGSDPEVVPAGISPNLHFQLGIPAQALPSFSVLTTQLPSGSAPTASVDNTNPLAPIITFGIPSGTDGDDGWGTSFSTLDTFTMPAVGATTGWVTIGDNRMVQVGTWVKTEGIGGSWFVVTAVSGDDQAQFRNPGPTDLIPYWGAAATSIPTNVSVGSTFLTGTNFVVVGAPGIIGLTGNDGTGVEPVIVVGVPNDPPALAENTIVVAYDNLVAPTWVRFYVWNGSSYDAGPNMMGPRGAVTFFGAADPNSSSPPGSVPGDLYIRQTGTTLQYFSRGVSVWTLTAAFSLEGTTTQAIAHSSPGTRTLDLSNFSYAITADKSIELDWSDTNYSEQGDWTAIITNTDGSPIALTYAAGRWEKVTGMTLPSTIGAGSTLALKFIKNTISGLYIFTDAFVPASV